MSHDEDFVGRRSTDTCDILQSFQGRMTVRPAPVLCVLRIEKKIRLLLTGTSPTDVPNVTAEFCLCHVLTTFFSAEFAEKLRRPLLRSGTRMVKQLEKILFLHVLFSKTATVWASKDVGLPCTSGCTLPQVSSFSRSIEL